MFITNIRKKDIFTDRGYRPRDNHSNLNTESFTGNYRIFLCMYKEDFILWTQLDTSS
jgi:hypothetical protein